MDIITIIMHTEGISENIIVFERAILTRNCIFQFSLNRKLSLCCDFTNKSLPINSNHDNIPV